MSPFQESSISKEEILQEALQRLAGPEEAEAEAVVVMEEIVIVLKTGGMGQPESMEPMVAVSVAQGDQQVVEVEVPGIELMEETGVAREDLMDCSMEFQ